MSNIDAASSYASPPQPSLQLASFVAPSSVEASSGVASSVEASNVTMFHTYIDAGNRPCRRHLGRSASVASAEQRTSCSSRCWLGTGTLRSRAYPLPAQTRSGSGLCRLPPPLPLLPASAPPPNQSSIRIPSRLTSLLPPFASLRNRNTHRHTTHSNFPSTSSGVVVLHPSDFQSSNTQHSRFGTTRSSDTIAWDQLL